MGFIRRFDTAKIGRLSGESGVAEGLTKNELYNRLMIDIFRGEVFPAIRKDEIYFYHKGGCLYKLKGLSFSRNNNYDKVIYNTGTECLQPYEKAKKQCANKYSQVDGGAKERQLLDRLNRHTYTKNRMTKVVVLDIEVRLNGEIGGNKKCDLALLNTETNEIMFVEGKVFSDKRVNVAIGFVPEVIEQVNTYTAAIKEQEQTIIEQYGEHIRIINELFETNYESQLTLIQTAKLLVYETPTESKITKNGEYSKQKITDALGEKNVAWYEVGEEPSIDTIWSALCR